MFGPPTHHQSGSVGKLGAGGPNGLAVVGHVPGLGRGPRWALEDVLRTPLERGLADGWMDNAFACGTLDRRNAIELRLGIKSY